MSNCRFCEGKMIKSTGVGDGIKTMRTMLDGLLSVYGTGNNDEYEDSDKACGWIMLKNGNEMAFDNSSGEYAEMTIQINYCPFCGEKL